MFILKKGHQPGVYVPLRALFLVKIVSVLALFGGFDCDFISRTSGPVHLKI